MGKAYSNSCCHIKKSAKIAAAVIIAVVLFFAAARFISGEDNWVCKDGQWAKHGHPSAPMPTELCK